jgi:hypothetical protein
MITTMNRGCFTRAITRGRASAPLRLREVTTAHWLGNRPARVRVSGDSDSGLKLVSARVLTSQLRTLLLVLASRVPSAASGTGLTSSLRLGHLLVWTPYGLPAGPGGPTFTDRTLRHWHTTASQGTPPGPRAESDQRPGAALPRTTEPDSHAHRNH